MQHISSLLCHSDDDYSKIQLFLKEGNTALEDDLTTSMPNYADGTRDITQDDVDELNRKLWKYEINTPNRIAHFLAQCAVESQRGFGRVE